MLKNDQEKLCLYETKDSVTSISTMDFVPQPLDEKSHFIRNRIFVGNFPEIATQKDINNTFRPFGKIIETNIIESTNVCSTGRYGFVTFQSIDSADAILSLYSRGREFRVLGEVVTINHALFKPKKHSNVKETWGTTANSKSVMLLGGQKVMAEYTNGMAYFRPLKEKSVVYKQLNTVMQKNFGATSLYPISPSFQLTNQFRFPAAYPTSAPLIRYSAAMPPQNMFGLSSRSMCVVPPILPLSMRPNFLPTQMPCYPMLEPTGLPAIR